MNLPTPPLSPSHRRAMNIILGIKWLFALSFSRIDPEYTTGKSKLWKYR